MIHAMLLGAVVSVLFFLFVFTPLYWLFGKSQTAKNERRGRARYGVHWQD